MHMFSFYMSHQTWSKFINLHTFIKWTNKVVVFILSKPWFNIMNFLKMHLKMTIKLENLITKLALEIILIMFNKIIVRFYFGSLMIILYMTNKILFKFCFVYTNFKNTNKLVVFIFFEPWFNIMHLFQMLK